MVTVTPVNDSPITLGQTVTVTEDGMVAIELHGSDVETAEADLTFTITSLPAEGSLKHGEVEVAVGDTFSGPPMLSTSLERPATGAARIRSPSRSPTGAIRMRRARWA